MVTEAKKQEVEVLKEAFNGAKCAVFANCTGIEVNDITALRNGLRGSDAKFKVLKNTLARIAAKGTQFEVAEDIFSGPVSVAFGFGEDISAPAKAIVDFAKENKKLEILGGLVEGSLLDPDGVKKLASMPPKPVVQAMFLGLMQAPARNFMGVLEGSARKFMYALNAIAEKKKTEGEG